MIKILYVHVNITFKMKKKAGEWAIAPRFCCHHSCCHPCPAAAVGAAIVPLLVLLLMLWLHVCARSLLLVLLHLWGDGERWWDGGGLVEIRWWWHWCRAFANVKQGRRLWTET